MKAEYRIIEEGLEVRLEIPIKKGVSASKFLEYFWDDNPNIEREYLEKLKNKGYMDENYQATRPLNGEEKVKKVDGLEVYICFLKPILQ